MRTVSQLIDNLMHDWYPAARPRVVITCPRCLYAHFTCQQCCSAVIDAQHPGILRCTQQPNASTDSSDQTVDDVIHVSDIAPDLALVDFEEQFVLHAGQLRFVMSKNNNNNNNQQATLRESTRKLLGTGSYGVVYEAYIVGFHKKHKNRSVAQGGGNMKVAVKEFLSVGSSPDTDPGAGLLELQHEIWVMRCAHHVVQQPITSHDD